MKKLISAISAVCLAAIVLSVAVVPAFAAEDVLNIDGGATANIGDTVTFTLNLDECKEEIIGFELRFFYNSDTLEYKEDSLSSEEFDNLIYNPNIEGKIPMNWTDIMNPVSFSTKKAVFSCDFTVKAAGNSDFSYFVTEMYDEDMVTLTSYKWSYDISVNGEPVVTEGILPINEDPNTLSKNQGGFVNYRDGMGDDNTPNSDQHDSVVGDNGVATHNVYENEVNEVTRVEEVDGQSKTSPTLYFIIAIPVLVILAGAAVVIVTKKSKKQNSVNNSENEE